MSHQTSLPLSGAVEVVTGELYEFKSEHDSLHGPASTPMTRSNRKDSEYEVVELPLLLPRWQALKIAEAARLRGMTTGQLLRRLIGEYVGNRDTPASNSSDPTS
jgi:hypothetical protein